MRQKHLNFFVFIKGNFFTVYRIKFENQSLISDSNTDHRGISGVSSSSAMYDNL
ncbi:hypothetical protein HMPREF3191_00122 [Veillonellaceae bacterium DNF00626]|nr:hypothetical protein HMPREF3191_00122 [Veillonellaceae bacterium DNF00626]